MSEILLINSPNRKSEPPRHYPYGIALISTILENEGHNIDTFDGNFSTFSELEEILKRKTFDFVGISGLITSYRFQEQAAKIVKEKNPSAVIASGGGLSSAVDTELLVLIPELDVLFIGEAEISIIEFMKRYKSTMDGINGIAYRKNGTIKRNPNSELNTELDIIPFPDLSRWDIEKYFDNKSYPLSPNTQSSQRRGNILTTRGCPYKCDFCFNTLGRQIVRRRSSENVLDEIDMLIRIFGIDFLSFMDEEFLVNKNLAEAIIEGIKQRGYSFQWGIAARSTSVTQENLRMLKEAGCDYIYFGFDSGSPETLLRMNKRMTTDDNFNAFRMTVEAGIFPVPNLIIGYDNESLRNIEENYQFLRRLIEYGKTLTNERDKIVFEKGFNNFGAIYFATPYPGSQLYERNKARLPSLRNILERVSFKDAYELTINVSEIPDEILVREQQKMVNYVKRFRL